MDESLLVYFNETLTGKLWLEENRTYHYRYVLEWLRSPHSIPLSVSLPLQDKTNAGHAVKFFFANILPEGSVRDRVAAKLGLSTKNTFGRHSKKMGNWGKPSSRPLEKTLKYPGQKWIGSF